MDFDVVVVGLGLVGGAALRHLADSGVSVVGIGPAEPEGWVSHRGPYASHYDSGRVTRRLDARYEWAELASRSIAAYPLLEERSGLRFHRPVGHVFVRRDRAGIEKQAAVIERLSLPVTVGSTDALDCAYVFPSGFTALEEPSPAGFLDPRMMLQAQLALAEQSGASIVRTWVTSMERGNGGFRIKGHDGAALHAHRVLMATGPYLNDLIPVELAAHVMPEAIVMGRVSDREADRLAELPSMIYLPDRPGCEDVYVVPPTRYPDGHWYLKIGGSIVGAAALETWEEKQAWMAGSAADDQLAWLRAMLETVLPGVAFEGFTAKPCLITDTAHGLPYIDEVEDGLFAAVGGNGHAAKSADAIGALAADLVIAGEWQDTVLDPSAFRAVFGPFAPISGGRHNN